MADGEYTRHRGVEGISPISNALTSVATVNGKNYEQNFEEYNAAYVGRRLDR